MKGGSCMPDLEKLEVWMGDYDDTHFAILMKKCDTEKVKKRDEYYRISKEQFEKLCEQIDNIRDAMKNNCIAMCKHCNLPILPGQYWYDVDEFTPVHKACFFEYIENNEIKLSGRLESKKVEKQKEAE
jgi:hypothetical protein